MFTRLLNKIPNYVGIIPYCLTKGEKYILLSRESYGKDIGLWSGFGGKPDANESIITTAARETFEESMGLLGDTHLLERNINKHAKCVDLGKSVYFYLPISYDQQFPEKFTAHRIQLTNKLGKPEYSPSLEKDQVKWTPINALHKLTDLRPKFRNDLSKLVTKIDNSIV